MTTVWPVALCKLANCTQHSWDIFSSNLSIPRRPGLSPSRCTVGRGQNEITPVTICYSLREWARGDTSSQTCSFSHSETAIIHFVWESCCKIFLWLSIKIQREAATASHFVKCIFCGWDNFWTCIVVSSKLWYCQTSFTSLFEVSSLVVGHGEMEMLRGFQMFPSFAWITTEKKRSSQQQSGETLFPS